jgi:phosphomannomutase/phosphoglucomutase
VSIYKPCDIRGDAATELTPALYHCWGRLLGGRVGPGAKFVVGGDLRSSTPELLAALIAGLCEAGLDVVNLGLLPTPMIYYARHRLQAAACAIVTASHNPAQCNGLKWMIGDRPPTEEDVSVLRREAENPHFPPSGRSPGTPRSLDISFDYVAWLQETWVDALSVERHVVLDPMHGCWARRARRYLQAVFPQCLFSVLHDEPDPAFGGRSPDCSQPQLLEDLCDAVYRQRAHLGLAFDGDGDRIALVDDKAVVLTAEEATWCLLQSLGTQLHNQRFVYDLKSSDRVPEAARQLGAEPLVERSGHSFIRTRMVETGALFGAEISGHYFFRALQGGDDGLYTACRLIAYLGQSGHALSQLCRECPGVFITPDLRVAVALEHQQDVIDLARAAWSEHPQTTIDGVRIDFPEGWALMRGSVTDPALTFRFEAADLGWLSELVRRFCDKLEALGDELWARYEAAMGSYT